MIQGPGNAAWEQRSSVNGGPQTDFSNMGQCTGDCQSLQIHVMVLIFVLETLKASVYTVYHICHQISRTLNFMQWCRMKKWYLGFECLHL